MLAKTTPPSLFTTMADLTEVQIETHQQAKQAKEIQGRSS